ncbi:MAG: hypothetical protein Q8O24_10680 [Gallionellaceae bacterium]|nr:hypothetical protein [Gallionellaceae bacterium]
MPVLIEFQHQGTSNNSNSVIDKTTSHLTKAASCQVIGYPAKAGIQFRKNSSLCSKGKPSFIKPLDSGLRRNDELLEVPITAFVVLRKNQEWDTFKFAFALALAF